MKRKTKIRALIGTSLIMFMAIFMVVQAFGSNEKMYLNALAERENGDVYKISAVNGYVSNDFPFTAWKIASYESMDNAATPDYSLPIYCVNPNKGFPNTAGANPGRQEYTYSFDMKTLNGLAQQYRDIIPTENYNKVLWILDNMYLPKHEDSAQLKQQLYTAAKEYGNKTNQNLDVTRDVLTDNDIEVVQQFALWYFTTTNSTTDPKYHFEPDAFPSVSFNGKDMEFEIFAQNGIDRDSRRYQDMKKLYKYFLESANSTSAAYGTTDNRNLAAPTLNFTKPEDNTETTIKTIGGVEYYVAGPYAIQANNTPVNYDITATVTNQSDAAITGYKVFDSSDNEISQIDKSLIKIQNEPGTGKEFYIAVPTTNTTVTKIKLKIKTSYYETDAKLWTRTDPTEDVQPVVIPKRELKETTIEKIVDINTPEFDLSLRKFITNINGRDITDRKPSVNTTTLKDGSSTTAMYTHPKAAIKVNTGDLVTYTIRVYNEGEISGYASEITDYIPEGLEFVETDQTNLDYKWIKNGNKITTNYLARDPLGDDNLIPKFNKNTMTEPASKEVKVVFRVTEPASSTRTLINIAEISNDSDANGEPVEDRDSTPNNVDTANYDIMPAPENSTYQQDDDDYEQLILSFFDLSLRKFITGVNDEEITTREPVVDLDDLKAGRSTTATYRHPKTPVLVKTGDLVTYTIRVYNEGEVDGFAQEIRDDVPEGLRFVPSNATNIKYKWVMWREKGEDEDVTQEIGSTHLFNGKTYVKTDNASEAKFITTDYLSKANGEDKLIKAFNKTTMNELKCQDVKVVFEVIEPNDSDRTLINIAEISEDADKDGNPAEDFDSEPNNNAEREDDIDKEYLVLVPPEEEFDLSLRKFITGVNDEEITTREPQVTNLDKLATDEATTTATYTHPKDPVLVKTGDRVTYTIRVYNEGDIDGYAIEIVDDIPEGLAFLPSNEINKKYKWKMYREFDEIGIPENLISYNGKGYIEIENIPENAQYADLIATDYLSKENGEDNLIPAFDKDNLKLSYQDVQVVFEVIEPNDSDRILENVAEINDDADENGEPVEDRDSEPSNSKPNEDDIDKEYLKLIPEEIFDLSLRKFITQVNDKEITNREPQVTNLDKLATGETTTATYTHPKNPVSVQNGDKIIYTIRVYNEGQIEGTATEIIDIVPEGLKFLEDSEINKSYKWKLSKDGKTVTTDFLKGKQIKAFNKATRTIYSEEVKIEFEVIEPNTSNKVLRNIAEITADTKDDRDSTPDNVDTDKYNPPADNSTYQEDDDDYEQVKLEYFDLSLRKFITNVNAKDVTTRYPVVTKNKEGKLVYTHTKEPVLVANNDIVIYTIRVYNEGSVAGYAEEITDDIPEGLTYLPKHEINVKYGWEVSEDGKKVSTDYLSKAKSEERKENNLLKAFDKDAKIAEGNPDYRDVQIAFKVTETNLATNRIIINTAEITDDSDEDGNPVEDIDSTPDNNNPKEDDIDKEYLKVQYFDLSLLKWVSKAIVIENGERKETETGHTGLENPEPVVKVDLDRKNIENITVKFEYVIKVTNEGEIEGYVKEISDYIPEGLKFVKEDNPDWEEKDGKIVTRKLENTLLKPGQSATVTVILTWINDGDNVGLKVNIAEISEDYNEHNSKDIDSTPNNKKEGEDDIDDAPVILTIKTGAEPTYIVLAISCVTIFTIGVILIKKIVLK